MRDHSSIVQVTGNNTVTTSGGDTLACNTDFFITADGYMALSSTNNGTISLSAAGALDLSACGTGQDVTINAGSDGYINALSPQVFKSDQSDVYVSEGVISGTNDLTLNAAGDDLKLIAIDSISQEATDGSWSVDAGTTIDLSSGTTATITGGTDVQITATGDDVVINSGDDVLINAGDDVIITPASGSGVVQMVGGGGTIQISDNEISTTTAHHLDLQANGGTNFVRVVTSDFEQVGASSTIELTGGNTLRTKTADNLILQGGAGASNPVVVQTSSFWQAGASKTTVINNGLFGTSSGDLTIEGGSGNDDIICNADDFRVSATNIDIDASGNINNHTGSYKFDSGTHHTVVNPCQGMMLEGNGTTLTNNWLACKVLMPVDGSMIIPFSVPDGATITRADIKVKVTASSTLRVKLMRKGFSYDIDINADQMDESTGVTGKTTVSLTSISFGTVDTSDFSYYWAIDETAGSGSGAEIGFSKIYFTMDTMAKKFSN